MAEEGFKRKLTAILSADVVEYSRPMGCLKYQLDIGFMFTKKGGGS